LLSQVLFLLAIFFTLLGAGAAGSALACALSHHPSFRSGEKKIVLIDPSPAQPLSDFSAKTSIPDQRCVSLTHSSIKFLREMGVWDLINLDRLGEIRQMQVWEVGGKSHVKFNDTPETTNLGYIIENKHLLSAIHERLRQLGTCDILIPEKITDFSVEPNSFAKLKLENKGEIEARLAVGSEGANSILKKKAKIGTWGWSSDQFGVVCTVKLAAHSDTAWQRFMSSGPIAVLPLYDEYSSIVWSCDPTWHERLMKMTDEEFVNELNYHLSRQSFVDTPNFLFNNSVFDYPPLIQGICNKRMSFPLKFGQSNNYV
jgi:ubiquinone biosynthesis monooxygenase Coq6